ncbi:unnamed protein product [Nezara viridula]|uniref:Uncharacterized protein n=1 Tax=Nezara viridula TaxID=85310 RepID=A0A9P0H8L9_NEZVI|nr:unnamed protein product [Nezara viridula]
MKLSLLEASEFSSTKVNSAVAGKERSRVHLCLGLVLRKP